MPHGVFHGMSKLLELTIAGEYLIYPSFHFVNDLGVWMKTILYVFMIFLRRKTECDLKDDMARTKQIKETESKSEQYIEIGKRHISTSAESRASGYFS